MKPRSVAGAALSLLLISALAAAACGSDEAQAGPTEAPERVAQVRSIALEPRDVVDRISVPADLLPLHRATLAAEVGGVVESVGADLGDRVRRGSVLATIDERALAQSVAEAEALLEQARLQHERARNLFDRRAVTQAQLLDAVTARDVAEARLATSRLQLDKARVQAPWSGQIAARHVEAGAYVGPGAPLFDLVDASRVKVRAPVRAADVPFLELGREVEITLDALPGERFSARVERLGAELDRDSRTLAVEAELPNDDGRLKPGMLARLEVPRRVLPSALVVPMASLIDLGGTKAVWLIENGRAVRRVVALGPVIGEEVVVQGLNPGDRVIVEGWHVVGEGQLVEEV